MDLFIETPNQVAQRQIREQQQQIETLNKATSAFNASQEAYLNAVKNAAHQGTICPVDITYNNSDDIKDTNALFSGLSQKDIDVIAQATHIACEQAKNTTKPNDDFLNEYDMKEDSPSKKAKPSFLNGLAHRRNKKQKPVYKSEYQREIEFDKNRQKLRILWMILKIVGIVFVTPLMVIAIFTAAYLMTCILNGATPAELPGLLNVMWDSGITFVMELVALI